MKLRLRLSLLVTVGITVTLSAQAPKPTFEVASVKTQLDPTPIQPPPERPTVFYRRNATVSQLIRFAFDLHATQLIGGPDWIKTFGFEITAKPAGPVSEQTMRLMVQSLLEDRFRLVAHQEQRDMRSARLVLANSDGALGPNLRKCDPEDPPKEQTLKMSATVRVAYLKCDPISAVASVTAAVLGFPVVDETQLTGLWTVELRYEPDVASVQQLGSRFTAPRIGDALKEQLGLKLESAPGPVKVIVIDSVRQPTEN